MDAGRIFMYNPNYAGNSNNGRNYASRTSSDRADDNPVFSICAY